MGCEGYIVCHACNWSLVYCQLNKEDYWSLLDHLRLDSWIIVVKGLVLISLEPTENPYG